MTKEMRNGKTLTIKENEELFDLTKSGINQSCCHLKKQVKADDYLRNSFKKLEERVSCNGLR